MFFKNQEHLMLMCQNHFSKIIGTIFASDIDIYFYEKETLQVTRNSESWRTN
jgi:hypothetical protein